jgi:hypothetical protein
MEANLPTAPQSIYNQSLGVAALEKNMQFINTLSLDRLLILALALVICSMAAFGCGGDSSDDDDSTSSEPADDDIGNDDNDDDSDDDADDDSDDDADDDSDDDLNDDTSDDDVDDDLNDDADDDTEYPQLPMPPSDGRLYVAAGQAVITPNEANHPGPIYMGGTSSNRVATGVHDDLLAAVLVLAKGDEHVVLVSLDLVGFSRLNTKAVQDMLGLRGLEPRNILVASTHNHEGPDTVGIWGPDPATTGVSPAYQRFIVESIVNKTIDLWEELTPATMKAGAVDINDPGSNHESLIRDSRQPEVVIPTVSAAQFLDDSGNTLATLVNWHSHPEVVISSREITADFPRWARERIEEQLGGVSVYISGAVGGLQTPLGVHIPARDQQGLPVLDEFGGQTYLSGQSWEATWSQGFVVADAAIQALGEAPIVERPNLSIIVADLPLPVQNPVFLLAYFAGILEPVERLFEPQWLCGLVGCADEFVALVRVGPVTLVTSPGETFPETILGREESVVDFGVDWGPFTFPALDGYINYLGDGVPMHMGLCGDEIGYMLPAADYHWIEHPDFYEESVSLGFGTETLYRQKVIEMLSGSLE